MIEYDGFGGWTLSDMTAGQWGAGDIRELIERLHDPDADIQQTVRDAATAADILHGLWVAVGNLAPVEPEDWRDSEGVAWEMHR